MSGITEQGHSSKGPSIEWLLIDHWIFEDGVSGLEDRWDIEEVEVPVLIDVDEVLDLAWPSPVTL